MAKNPFPNLFLAADMPKHVPTATSRIVAVVRSLPGGQMTEIAVRRALGVHVPAESRATLRMLRSHDIPTGVVSNVHQRTLDHEVPRHLEDLSEGIVYRGLTGDMRRKPHTDGVMDALDALQLTPSADIWMVGDRYSTDMLAAMQAGLSAVLIHPSAKELTTLHAHQACATEQVYKVEGHRSLMELLTRSMNHSQNMAR